MTDIDNVVSLFDGLSGCRIALKEIGITPKRYYASEIDKRAISVAQDNFPDTIQLGSVTEITAGQFDEPIDLLTAGSPCTDMSIAGTMRGMVSECGVRIHNLEQYLQMKSDGYTFSGQSYLFWEAMRLVKELKPKYFMFENVNMKQEWVDVISEATGVTPVMLNSAMFSPQCRERLYWVGKLGDDGKYYPVFAELDWLPKTPNQTRIMDILTTKEEDPEVVRYGTYDFKVGRFNDMFSSACVFGIANDINGKDILKRIYSVYHKSPTLTAVKGGHQDKKIAIPAYHPSIEFIEANAPLSCDDRVFGSRYRSLTIRETARLQTIPDWFKFNCSRTAALHMIGNGWTINVIKHIFMVMLNK